MILTNVQGISIHWSSDCNMACTYCYIKKDKSCMHDLNQKICQSLNDGSYVENIKEKFEHHKQHITHMSLWGAEPTLNGKYFKDFVNEMLDFFPNLYAFMFSTNALVGGKVINKYFVEPIIEYANEHQRHITFTIQFSLDGPDWINDASRHPGATQNTMNTVKHLIETIPESDYANFCFTLKPTLSTGYMQQMNDKGMSSFEEYYQFFDAFNQECLALPHAKNLILDTVGIPTLVDPGNHTPEDGKIFAEWLKNLLALDSSKFESYKDYRLIQQPLIGLIFLFNEHSGHLSMSANFGSCSAGRNEVTIDYQGNLYSCERIAKNLAYLPDKHPSILDSNSTIYTNEKGWLKRWYANESFHYNFQARRLMAEPVLLFAARTGLIDEKYFYDGDARTLLFYMSIGLMCHIGIEEDLTGNPFVFPLSYAQLLGNGAADLLLKYYIEGEREGKLWK